MAGSFSVPRVILGRKPGSRCRPTKTTAGRRAHYSVLETCKAAVNDKAPKSMLHENCFTEITETPIR